MEIQKTQKSQNNFVKGTQIWRTLYKTTAIKTVCGMGIDRHID